MKSNKEIKKIEQAERVVRESFKRLFDTIREDIAKQIFDELSELLEYDKIEGKDYQKLREKWIKEG